MIARLSDRSKKIKPSFTLEMTSKAAKLRSQGVDVINFSAGQPDFNTPKNIINAAKNAMDSGFTKYTPGSGIRELKEAVCQKIDRDNNLSYSPENVVVSCGGKHALYNACQVLFEHGDEVIIFTPYWVSFPDFVSVTGAKPIFVNTISERQYEPDFSDLELRSDNGALVENFVFTELLKYLKVWHELFFWRTPQGTETDFILKRDKNLFPIEVKYKLFKKPIVPSGLKSFINNYQANIKTAFVLTKDFSAQIEFNGITVNFLPVPITAKIFDFIKLF
jgi:hypothetical protein